MSEKDIKKVGIVADNYKLNKFKKELEKKGFTDYKITPYMTGTSAITVDVPSNKVYVIHKIVTMVTIYFTNRN